MSKNFILLRVFSTQNVLVKVDKDYTRLKLFERQYNGIGNVSVIFGSTYNNQS